MLPCSPVLVALLLASRSVVGSIESSSGGWQGISGSDYGTGHGVELVGHGLSDYGSYGGGGIGHGLYEGHVQHHYAPAVPVSQHVEITKPVPVPVVKNVGVPVAQPVAIGVPHPVAVGVPQPFPVHVPVAKPVAIPVVKTVAIPVEKKVPFPVEKVIPVPVEKHVPITVEKHIPVPVEKPYPIHVPVYKHVFHRVKSHGYGWSH
ncbi:zinc finger protein [Apis mellifera caucasica]|uniref:Zinc finger protein 512B n=1 Tax=Apis mellifera TaxID=7460 RepID=A0A7M7FZQ9_APIME|nr:zinc finger protein 512B [Apis mellifera]KAG6801205.1 zinc finger protein [Apis mellifera caucasica]|eukprot:XP_001121697.3 zinc finger protein 512B [Apis mellifera]